MGESAPARRRTGARSPTVVVITGPPCSGKSRLSAEVAKRRRTPVLDVDEVRIALLPTSAQAKRNRDLAYRCQHAMLEKLLQVGVREVLVVATYARCETRNWLKAILDHLGCRLCVIECKVDPELAVARFMARPSGHAAVDLNEGRVRRLATQYRYGCGLLVDTSLPIAKCLNAVLEYIGSKASVNAAAWVELTMPHSRRNTRRPPEG